MRNVTRNVDKMLANITIHAVHHQDDMIAVNRLACEIWQAHYRPIIGQEQVDYMLATFQSVEAISWQITDGYRYFLVKRSARPVAYFALLLCPGQNSAHISKLYVSQKVQRCGLGRQMMAYIEEYCLQRRVKELWLTVNRYNEGSIQFYLDSGFCKVGSLVQDIGGGFVMDDFKMSKTLV